MVKLTLQDSLQMREGIPKFKQILAAWELNIVEQSQESGQMKLVIDARYFSQTNLVVAIARTNFKDALIKHESEYQPDPPKH